MSRRGRAATTLVVAGALVAFGAPVLANGRFPNAQQMRELDPETLVVAGTYGLLVTTNGGIDFQYVCESEMFGKPAGGFTLDPLLELAPDGSYVTGSVQAARVTRDRGCGFEMVATLPRSWAFFGEEPPPSAETGRVADLSRRGTGADAPLLALVALTDAGGIPLEHRIYEARNGTDFEPLGAPIALELVEFGLTLDAAPSEPDRLYLTGTLANAPVLVRSRDGGEAWESVPIVAADPDEIEGAYLAAVSPTEPERVYVRVQRRKLTEDGFYLWDDSLLVSDDGGDAFFEPLRREAALLGFALLDGGATVLAGYGDPRADPALSSPDDLGIYAASGAGAADALAFERIVSDIDVNCLYASPSGLYACATEQDPLGVEPSLESDFHLGIHRGSALPAARADFTPLLKLRDVRGPPPQADGSAGPCDAEWRTGDPTAPVPVGACAAFFACDSDPAEVSAGALVCGGGGGAGAPGEPPGPARASDSGCGCRTAGGGTASGFVWTVAFLLGGWHRFRARCRR